MVWEINNLKNITEDLMSFIEGIKEKARENVKTIVLPESMDERTYAAAEITLKEKNANLIIIGTDEEIAAHKGGIIKENVLILQPKV